MTKKMSICMIVKDEEKNLRRCLDSLKLLIEEKHIELIIVDTGSNDNTVSIAREYTDRVYFHDWNGSFSAMRNISISYATGEWIFIIDADEELETPEGLLSLLMSKPIEKYKTVRIKEKNLISTSRNKLILHTQERLFRNDGTFRYEGTIHNQPIFQHPVLTVGDIWLIHYGYVSEDKELMEKKFKRTAGMLEKELQKDPENVYYRFQLARSYTMHDEHYRAYEEIKKAYTSIKKQPEDIIKSIYLYGEYARICLSIEKFQEVIEVCNEGLKYEENYLDLYFYMGHALLSLEDNNQGVNYLLQYLDFYNKYNNNELNLSNFFTADMFSADTSAFEQTLNRLVSLIYSHRSLSLFISKIKNYIEQIADEVLKTKLLIKVYIIESSFGNILHLYEGINEIQRYNFIGYLEGLKRNLNKEEQVQIEHLLSIKKDDYGLLNLIRIQAENKHKLILEFMNNFDIMKFPEEIIFEFVKYLIDLKYINRFFRKENNENIKRIVSVLIDTEGRLDYLLDSLNKDFGFNDFHNNRVFLSIANVILLKENEKDVISEDIEILDLLDNYIQRGINYIGYLYNLDHLRLTYKTISIKEDVFFALFHLANISLQNNDVRGYNRLILEATKAYPYLSKLVKVYLSDKIRNNS